MSEAAFVLVLVLATGAPLILYVLIREETANPRIVDRETAERDARARGGIGGRSDRTSDRRDDSRSEREPDSGRNRT